MSSSLASLFIQAKDIGMMTKDCVWIMTDGLANLIESLDPSVVESMNGALGVEFHVPKSKELDNFTTRWNIRFLIENPTDQPLKTSIYGLWGYNTIWAVAQAAEKVGISNARFQKPLATRNLTRLEDMEISSNGPELLSSILQNNFRGLSGNFDLQYKQLEVSTFRIINVVGKGGREIGFWTAENGISRKLNQTRLTTAHSGSVPVIWPGESIEVARGFKIPVRGKILQVGVLSSGYAEFIKVEMDNITGATKASGLSVDVFEEAVKRLPYALPYEYVTFGSTEEMSSRNFDEVIYEVYLKQLQPTVTDVHELLRDGKFVGYHRGSYIKGVLEELGFDRSKIKAYDMPDDFNNALSRGSNNGGIAALVHEVTYIKLFLAKHCEGYTMVRPIYKAAGFGYFSDKTIQNIIALQKYSLYTY
ncbi:Glutamate receptor 2.2 [Dichanthelium oligosanthes]|uniref:Glutamate receptor 2.2 n=1 Tax=Dichanthelium oligosanthes TaxID=888268 RepID=A0A1E5WF85_9POAL|nr:Glutamate receptor 2.2 [Dichanthelium oligosanthes]